MYVDNHIPISNWPGFKKTTNIHEVLVQCIQDNDKLEDCIKQVEEESKK